MSEMNAMLERAAEALVSAWGAGTAGSAHQQPYTLMDDYQKGLARSMARAVLVSVRDISMAPPDEESEACVGIWQEMIDAILR